MISPLSNYRPFFSFFLHIPSQESFVKVSELNTVVTKWRPFAEEFLFGQNWPKSLGDGRQDICKDKESNLGPVAGH